MAPALLTLLLLLLLCFARARVVGEADWSEGERSQRDVPSVPANKHLHHHSGLGDAPAPRHSDGIGGADLGGGAAALGRTLDSGGTDRINNNERTRSSLAALPRALAFTPAHAQPLVDRPLVFVHLPKCGGTALHALLLSIAEHHHISRNEFCDDLMLPRILFEHKNSYAPVSHCRVVVGHVASGLADGYDERFAPAYVTVLRDPIERVLSLYNYARRTPEHHQHRLFASRTLSELVAIAAEEHRRNPGEADWNNTLLVTNRNVWRLCGHRCHHATLHAGQALAQARARLTQQYAVVGTTEEMDVFARALLRFTNTPHAPNFVLPRDNVRPAAHDPDLHPADRARLAVLLAPERALHRLARRLAAATTDHATA